MLSIIGQITCCLILAAIIGFIVGWLIRGPFRKDPTDGLKQGVDTSQGDLYQLNLRLQDRERRIKELEDINQGLRASLAVCEKGQTKETLPKDDLKKIWGIGPHIEQVLNSLGIVSFKQIATFTESDIKRIEGRLEHFTDRIRRDAWIMQARKLHKEKYGEEVG